MAQGWSCTVDGDITVTNQLRIYVNGAEWLPPADWILHLATEGNRIRVVDAEFSSGGVSMGRITSSIGQAFEMV